MNSQKHQHKKAFRTYPALFTLDNTSKDSDLTGMQAARCIKIIKGCTDVGHRTVEPSIIWIDIQYNIYIYKPCNLGLTRTRRNSLMLHAFLVLAAGVPQVLLRTQYRVWMPADAKAAHVKPQHAWSLLQICLANYSMQVKGEYNVTTLRRQ